MYSTTSLNLAAYLLARGHKVTVTGASQSKEFRFDSETVESDAEAYYQNALIEARLYSAALSDLKRLLHQAPGTAR